MEAQILRLLGRSDYVPANVPELLRQLRLAPPRQQELQRALRGLEQSGQVARIKGNRYVQPREADLVPGRIRINRQGKGFLQPDAPGLKEIMVPEEATSTALHEDRVLVRRDVKPKGLRPARLEQETGTVIRITDPRLGETVLDPASGTGGFLVEAFNHLSQQVKTVADRKVLQERTLLGCEPKPLPYLLCQMNLLLHGLDAPQIDPGNSLRHKLTDIGERDRVDVILTNPPFGGEEEKGIQGNFPEDKQTAETALLFLQLIMRKLRRSPRSTLNAPTLPARAAVVVPNGTLFGDGVCARIKEELLKDFNLHTIVRLPNGVFAPYTSIPTNILFFDRSGPTRDVWYYEQPLPEGKKNYTKTAPVQFEEFAACIKWWGKRKENDQAWKVPAAELLAHGCNLDRKNPRAKEDITHLPPEQLAASILQKEHRITEIMGNIQKLLSQKGA